MKVKFNIPFTKAIAIITLGSGLLYTGTKLIESGAIATSIAGIATGAIGVAKLIHEFEKSDRIYDLKQQAEYWEKEAWEQRCENHTLLRMLQDTRGNDDTAQTFITLGVFDSSPELADKRRKAEEN